jgi:hypothetical protein
LFKTISLKDTFLAIFNMLTIRKIQYAYSLSTLH